MMKIVSLITLFFLTHFSTAQNNAIQTSGDIILVLLPSTAVTTTFIKKDKKGTWQFTEGFVVTTALTVGLKLIVDKERPNGKDNYSFPSGHTANTFQAAAFLQKRYGWKFGIPAYTLAAYTGYSRIKSKNHDLLDVVVGAIIGVGSSYVFTTKNDKNKINISFDVINSEKTISFKYAF